MGLGPVGSVVRRCSSSSSERSSWSSPSRRSGRTP